ncbi:hypothetical protein Q8A67_007040 [Cirrhinus molitorella]|uniref:DUF4592 domain-containing protein n=1 Tax=Cirrhinus molitorella TaxID=172907 RepID=A0AA88Q5M0_9TELE|nr:hypothetical protein Q8A67_007040 [Cirrhinus molitorella]
MNVLEPSGDPEGEGSDDLTGRKKSRLKSKSRLFGKIRRKEDDGGGMKQSQSESDITLSVEDSDFSKGMLGSRAFSHDSIFNEEHSHLDPEPLRILSQENIHGKIRALQVKLQQQKLHLGPPPHLLPIKRREDFGGSSEDDGLPRSPSEVSHGEGLYTSVLNKFSIPPKNSTLSLAGTESDEEVQASSQPLAPRPISPVPAPLSPGSVDFSTPPQFTSLLDNSAARHRMSIKPKNQRASAKNKRATTPAGSRARSESLNNLDQSLTTREEKEGTVKEIPRAHSYSSQVLRGERLTTLQIKSPAPVSPLMSLQTSEDSRKVTGEPENEQNILSTSPPSPSIRETTPAVTPVAKPPIPVLPIDKKGKGQVSEMLSSSKLLKNSQSTTVSTVSPSVTTTAEQCPVKDEKSNTVPIQTKMDTLSKYSVQNAANAASTEAPTNVICGVNLRPSSLRRNTPSTDEKHESKTLQPVSTASAVSHEDHTQTESIKRQRTVSGSFHFSVSSDKNQERPRTASFTGVVGQAGLKKEPPSPAKPPLNFRIERQVSSHVEKAKKDQCAQVPPTSKKEDKTDTSSVIPTKFTDLAKSRPRAPDVEENQDNEKQEIAIEATEDGVQEVEVAEEACEDVMEEATNAFGVKLRSTSLSLRFRLDKAQSGDRVKRHSVEGSAPISPPAAQSDSTSHVEPDDQRTGMGSTRVHAKLKDPPLQTDASDSPPKSSCKDKERAGVLRQAEPSQPSSSVSKFTKIVPSQAKEGTDLPPEEITAVPSKDNPPTSATSEVSWMEMAREKTRSLQQLFTSRLPEFPSLQSRPTTLTTTQPQTQTSTSQANSRIIQPTTTPLLRSTETKPLPSAQHSGRSTQTTTQTRTTTNQPSETSTQTTTSQSQTDSAREVQFQSKTQICNSTTKPTQSTVTCTSYTQTTTVHTAKQPLQPLAPQTPPIQLSSPLRAASQTHTQAILRSTSTPGYPHLLSSPKLTSHLVFQQSVSKDQPQNDGGEPSVISGKADRASMSQGKETGPEDGRPVWAAGLGNKTSLLQRWENQTTVATKTGELKSTAESQTTSQSTVPPRPISKVSSTGTGLDSSLSMQASVSSVPMRSADREDKWQQKPSSPSSSPSSSPLQSVRDNAQPSWMELAKRKSLAWSDKTMD